MKYKKQIVIGMLASVCLFCYSTTCKATSATVNTETLNLRKEASTESNILEQLNAGQKLEIIEKSGDWYKVRVNNITGFVHKEYIKLEENAKEDVNTTNEISENVTNEVTNTTVAEEQNNESQAESLIMTEKTLKKEVNVYILPLINSNKLEKLSKDSKVIIMDEANSWIYVQTDKVSGWIRKEAIDVAEQNNNENANNGTGNNTTNNEEKPKEEETQVEKKTMYVNSNSIYVRKGPGTNYEIIDSLILNAGVIVTAEVDDWYKIEVNGKEGYIAKRLLSAEKQAGTSRSAEERTEEVNKETNVNTEPESNSSKGEQIAEYAKQYLGCKYVYGGSGPNIFDCSGFTMYVYKKIRS